MVSGNLVNKNNKHAFRALNFRQLYKVIQSVNNIVNNEVAQIVSRALLASTPHLQNKSVCDAGRLLMADGYQAITAQEGNQ